MPATFDEHVNEALALIAADRRPAARARTTQTARARQGTRPRLILVPHPDAHGKSER
ncbi:hypothetical protein ACIBEA_38695 [Streptomyces sp. NPDC051555]|uniref:hypothetical protein n=1 Tax=Streptomyces sp. NPDC051555 TaxID=3365657 RepID=UPI0037A44C0A